jgi:hypothetical protein
VSFLRYCSRSKKFQFCRRLPRLLQFTRPQSLPSKSHLALFWDYTTEERVHEISLLHDANQQVAFDAMRFRAPFRSDTILIYTNFKILQLLSNLPETTNTFFIAQGRALPELFIRRLVNFLSENAISRELYGKCRTENSVRPHSQFNRIN